MTLYVTIAGCDDSTYLHVKNVDGAGETLLRQLAAATKETYGCQPRLAVTTERPDYPDEDGWLVVELDHTWSEAS